LSISNKIKTTQTFCENFVSSVNIIVSRKNQLIESRKKIKKETIKKRKQYVINPK